MHRAALASAACYRTHRAKTHGRSRGDRKKHAHSGVFARDRAPASPLPLPTRDGTDLTRRFAESPNDVRLEGDVRGDVMRGLTRFARYLVPSVLVVCVMSLGAPCAAQENVDPPTVPAAPDAGDGRGSLFAPSAWLVLSTPVQKQIDLKLYGFYIGRLDTPVAQVDVPIRTTKFLTVTPSYMDYSVPASGLNKLPPQPGRFTDSYEEHQFRIDGTVAFAVRKFEISARNMYVRRFRPAPAD